MAYCKWTLIVCYEKPVGIRIQEIFMPAYLRLHGYSQSELRLLALFGWRTSISWLFSSNRQAILVALSLCLVQSLCSHYKAPREDLDLFFFAARTYKFCPCEVLYPFKRVQRKYYILKGRYPWFIFCFLLWVVKCFLELVMGQGIFCFLSLQANASEQNFPTSAA